MWDTAPIHVELTGLADTPDPAAFQVPAEQLIEEWPKGRLSWNALLQLKQRWQISLAALLYRGRDLVRDIGLTNKRDVYARFDWESLRPEYVRMYQEALRVRPR